MRVSTRVLLASLTSLSMLISVACKAQKVESTGSKAAPQQAAAKIAHYEDWNTISIPGVCCFQAPKTLEIKDGLQKEISDKLGKLMYGFTGDPDRVTLQQKGLNDFDPAAYKKYCRVLVETELAPEGELPRLGDDLDFTREELTELENDFKLGMSEQSMIKIIDLFPLKIVNVNGIDAMLISYRRESTSEGKTPVIVKMYTFFNYNKIHRITLSYRESESAFWKEDLEKIIYTFSFEKC
jgi:hypothetical protein